jgi:hypothetical protein
MSRAISYNSQVGRMLITLRAAPMSSGDFNELYSSGSASIHQLKGLGYIELVGGRYVITAAGLAVCPLRNPAAAMVAPIGRSYVRELGAAA